MGLTLFNYYNTGKSKLYLPSFFSKAQSFIGLIVPFWLKKILSHWRLQYWANKDRWLEAKYFDLKTRLCRRWCFLDDINELWLLKRGKKSHKINCLLLWKWGHLRLPFSSFCRFSLYRKYEVSNDGIVHLQLQRDHVRRRRDSKLHFRKKLHFSCKS